MKICKICKKEYDDEEGGRPIYKYMTSAGEREKTREIVGYNEPFRNYCLSCSVNKNGRWRRFTQFMWCCSCIWSIVLMIIPFVLFG